MKESIGMRNPEVVRNNEAECIIHQEVKVIVGGQSENPTRMNLTSGKLKMVIDDPENSCPVTDNVRADTSIYVVSNNV